MTAPPASATDLQNAVEFASEAGELTLTWFKGSRLELEHKSDGSPVTAADKAAEALLCDRIGAMYPDDSILGEEHGVRDGTSSRRWVIDPIDGTKAFSRGVELYSTLLCLEDEYGPAVGVIGLPALGEMVVAGRGLGCTWNGQPARVSSTSDLSQAIVCTSETGYWDPDLFGRLVKSGVEFRTWGDAYGYALVATGRVDAMVDPKAAYWDVAPVGVILSEAGGTFTGWDGSPGPGHGSGVGSNGVLHEALLDRLHASSRGEHVGSRV